MSRQLQEGDRAVINTPSSSIEVIISALTPNGIYVTPDKENLSLLVEQNGQWQVYKYNQPHSVEFKAVEPESEPEHIPIEVGDVAEVTFQPEITKRIYVVKVTPEGMIVKDAEGFKQSDQEYFLKHLQGYEYQYLGGKFIVDSDEIIKDDQYIHGDMTLHNKTYYVTAINPGQITITNNEETHTVTNEYGMYYLEDVLQQNIVNFKMNPQQYAAYLKTPQNYIPNNQPDLTWEELQMTPIVSLIHHTNLHGLRNILMHGKLDHRLALINEDIQVTRGIDDPSTIAQIEKNTLENLPDFPGVYTYLLTQYHILSNILLRSTFFKDDFQLVISPSLLLQKKWDPLESTCRHASLSIL